MQAQAFSQEKPQAKAALSAAPHGREKTFAVIEGETLMPSDVASAAYGAGFAFRDLRRHRPATRPSRRPNMLGLTVTGLLHLAVAAALLLQWQINKPKTPEPILFVQITEQKAVKPIETPPAPKLETPKVDMPVIRLPDIPRQTNAITLPPQPVAAPTPPAAPDIKVVETYQLKLMRHLNAYKRYPRGSQFRRDEGVAYLSFIMDRHGSVLTYKLTRTSGHREIDEAALALIQRANPLPAPPDELWREPMEIEIPIEYALKERG